MKNVLQKIPLINIRATVFFILMIVITIMAIIPSWEDLLYTYRHLADQGVSSKFIYMNFPVILLVGLLVIAVTNKDYIKIVKPIWVLSAFLRFLFWFVIFLLVFMYLFFVTTNAVNLD